MNVYFLRSARQEAIGASFATRIYYPSLLYISGVMCKYQPLKRAEKKQKYWK